MGMISYLYNRGEQVVSWEKNRYVYSNSPTYYDGNAGTISVQSNRVVVQANDTSAGRGAKWVTSQGIDITNVSKLHIAVDSVSSNQHYKGYGLARSLNGYCAGSSATKWGTYNSAGLKTYDISDLTGDVYVSIFCMANNGNGSSAQGVYEVYLEYAYDFNVVCDSDKGSVASTTYLNTFTLTTTANDGYVFKGYYVNGVLVSTDSTHTFTLDSDITVYAEFYEVNLTYDSILGSASYVDNGDGTITLSETPNASGQFVGWYVNSVQISNNPTYVYTVLSDVTIEARFEPIYQVTDSVSGNGAISYTRGADQNDVTFTVIPSANWHFVKYVVGVDEYTSTPLSLHLTADISITAVFEENDKFTVSTRTNIDYASVYVSDSPVYVGTVVTLYARPMPDYYFVRWEDGNSENPREITVTEDVLMVAIYQRMADDPNVQQYRCYIKDQLSLTDPPKAFLRVDQFTVKTDLMTNANSTIKCLDVATNVNNGDVLVLYDATGQTLYQGVIKSIADQTITCSQMQSFYKGTWIYNVHPSTYLEEEIAWLLDQYSLGKIYQSTYTDQLVAQRLGGITVQYEGNTSANLPTDLDKDGNEQYTTKDFEKFIYSLYEDYGIIFDFEINFSGANYVTVKMPDYSVLKVGNNMYAIKDMSPITTIEETNRLIIFNRNKTYRTTYVATANGIVENPTTTANRFNITNTKVVFSDDATADLVSANLPDNMYNHKLTFTLVIKNFIYQFGDFNLGGSLDVWHGDDYYNTVLTGYEIKKASRQNITEVGFTCGLVRTALTKKLTLGVVL